MSRADKSDSDQCGDMSDIVGRCELWVGHRGLHARYSGAGICIAWQHGAQPQPVRVSAVELPWIAATKKPRVRRRYLSGRPRTGAIPVAVIVARHGSPQHPPRRRPSPIPIDLTSNNAIAGP